MPSLDKDALLRLLQDDNREANYAKGVDMLKFQMVPALQGHDYVPPFAQFNDTPTLQEFARNPTIYNHLQDLQKQFEFNLNAFPHTNEGPPYFATPVKPNA